jgi:hypothetical protein
MERAFTCVIKLSAVIGRREQCYQLTLREELVAIFDHLMGTTDQVEVVLGQELCNNLEIGG